MQTSRLFMPDLYLNAYVVDVACYEVLDAFHILLPFSTVAHKSLSHYRRSVHALHLWCDGDYDGSLA